MQSRIRATTLLLLVVLLLGAAPDANPDELVRQGNAAFERQDFRAALDFYTRAEERIINPGLVAYNKGVALYKLGDFHGAELHFQRCLEDADGPRRANMLYDLGTSLLQQAQSGDQARFKPALECFLRCLKEPGIDEELTENARHNLELAKLLWRRARLSRPNPQDSGSNPEPKNEPPRPKDRPPEPLKVGGGDPGSAAVLNPSDKGEKVDDPRGHQTPIKTDASPPPGQGTLPPIPDKDQLVSMPPDEALKHLKAAAERIRSERRSYRQSAGPGPSRSLLDW